LLDEERFDDVFQRATFLADRPSTVPATEIVVPPSELEKLGRSADAIRPGMPVEIVILLKKRTALDYLIEPLTRSLWRTGSEQ
jgi:hypothetical protein